MSYESKYQTRRRRRRSHNVLPLVCLLLSVGMLAVTVCVVLSGARDPDITFSEPPGDSIPPVITGVQDLLVYENHQIAYRTGVEVTDDTDEFVTLQVDNSAVDLQKAGVYPVVYTATDSAGNTAQATAQVTVLQWKDGYAELSTIEAAADDVLKTLINGEMDSKQCVRAVYRWARQNLSYGGHSDRADWRQAAYTMLLERTGDCYGYYAVTKLLFERLSIPNIDVVKVKNDPNDSNHFWSLVSVDQGKTYYHFDATPRVGDGDDFCLVTDAFLDAYSSEHEGSHNRDTSLYPPTPED